MQQNIQEQKRLLLEQSASSENDVYSQQVQTIYKASELPPNSLSEHRLSYRRWIILALGVCFFITNYFCYMLPASLQSQYTHKLNLTLTAYNWIQSIYSLPNIILPLIGGIFIDYFGMRLGMLIFTGFLVLGQFIQCIGYLYDSSNEAKYVWILVGRAVFGIGGESMCITMNAFISKWFQGQEVSIALAIIVSSAGLGMVVSGMVSYQIYEVKENLGLPLFVSVIVMVIGFVVISGVCILDKRVEEHDEALRQRIAAHDVRFSTTLQNQKETEEAQKETQKIRIRDILTFPRLYWMLCLSMIIMYGQLIPFQNNLQSVLQVKYQIKPQYSGKIFTIPLIIQLIFCPLGGALVDNFGKRAEVNILSCFVMMIQFALWAFGNCDISPCYASYYAPLVLYGIANSTYNNFIWPGVALSIPERFYGSAFGFLDCLQQLGIAVFPLIASAIYNSAGGGVQPDGNVPNPLEGYFWFFIFFGILAILGTVVAFWIYFYDMKNGKILDKRQESNLDPINRKKSSVFQSRLKASFYV